LDEVLVRWNRLLLAAQDGDADMVFFSVPETRFLPGRWVDPGLGMYLKNTKSCRDVLHKASTFEDGGPDSFFGINAAVHLGGAEVEIGFLPVTDRDL